MTKSVKTKPKFVIPAVPVGFSTVDTVDKEGGNTKTPSLLPTDPVLWKDDGKQHRRWCFTVNNPAVDTVDTFIATFLDAVSKSYVFQYEVGRLQTPHYQGYFEGTNHKFTGLKRMLPQAHFEPAVASADVNYIYCTTVGPKHDDPDSKRLLGPWIKNMLPPEDIFDIEDELEGKTYYPWQQDIHDLHVNRSKRKVHWFWEPVGNVGKTMFARHMLIKHKDCLMVGGSASDVKYAVAQRVMPTKPGILPANLSTVFWNITRKHGVIDYEGIEAVSDGTFSSSKYESGQCIVPRLPTIIVFANHAPDMSGLSADRWIVHLIGPPPVHPIFSPVTTLLDCVG